eukprot:IDg20696t1
MSSNTANSSNRAINQMLDTRRRRSRCMEFGRRSTSDYLQPVSPRPAEVRRRVGLTAAFREDVSTTIVQDLYAAKVPTGNDRLKIFGYWRWMGHKKQSVP